MKRAALARSLAIVGTLLGAGCALPLDLAAQLTPLNTCSTSTDCAGNAVCVHDACVATSVDLEGLVIEVRPHANAAFGATTSYLFDPAAAGIPLVLSGSQPFLARMDPALPAPISIRGGLVRLDPGTPLEQGCTIGANRSIPAHLTFYRVAPFAGIAFDPISASTDADNEISVDLVPGTYDVYIEPQPVAGCNGDGPFPPVYRTGLEISKEASALLFDLPVVGTLNVTINDAADTTLTGWRPDLVEPIRGLPISSNPELTANETGGYAIKAQISWPEKDTPIVRLRPPEGTVQPTAYWNLSVMVGTTTNPVAEFTAAELFLPPVKVTSDVLGPDGFTPARASLSIQSVELQGPNKQNAAFAVDNVQTDENGTLSILLPPGKYGLRAFPIDDGLAVTDATFEINPSATCFCGQTFPLAPKQLIAGSARAPDGSALAGATVLLRPSQRAPRNYWSSTHALPPASSRETMAVTSDDGSFGLAVDPGTADLVIVSDPSSGYPWLVRPGLELSASLQLASLQVKYPAMLSGVVRDPKNAVVADAEINAWLPVRDPSHEGALTGTVVKVATTSTDANGAYTLLLPSSM
jgi:hypothetical protein